MQYDLAVIIPGRNEEFQARTVEDVLAKKRGNTQVIAVMDEKWSEPGIKDHKDLVILKLGKANGQRGATIQGAKLANAKYLMKLDSHCIVSEGFDVELLKAFEILGDEVTQIPAMYNLWAFDWKCKKCGTRTYQGPRPDFCMLAGESRKKNPDCDGTEFERIMVWQKRGNRRSEAYMFDTEPHFQYDRRTAKKQTGDYIETMSAQGSCFVMTKKRYFDLNIDDESLGSWGSQGIMISCKTWLTGGRLITNRKCWYAHMFRTQKDFSFPYPQDGKQVSNAKKVAKDLVFNNKIEGQTKPLSWLLEKFKPLPDWHDPKNKEILDKVIKAGEEFNMKHSTKGIIYYTNNKCPIKIAKMAQNRLRSIGLPIVSASLKPMDFGKNIHLKLESGYLSMFKQILTALENSESEIVFFCEHDVVYDKSHFDFTPKDKETWYYNTNVLKVRWEDGHAVKVDDCKQVSGICVYRETAIKHYKKRIEMVENYKGDNLSKYIRAIGFEPATHSREERVDNNKCETWQSKEPNLDIRHSTNLTQTRWTKEQFRNEKFTKGWFETKVDLR